MRQNQDLELEIAKMKKNGAPAEAIHKKLIQLGKIALDEGNTYIALKAYIELNDRQKVRNLGDYCINMNHLLDAEMAFLFLDDKDGLLRVINKAENKESKYVVWPQLVQAYIGENTIKKLSCGLKDWLESNNLKRSPPFFEVGNTAIMAYELRQNYDLAVGVAYGGLFSAYIFDLIGHNTKILESHRRGKEATLDWRSEISPIEIEGKRVLVLDKDVVTGRTTGKVAKEILKCHPERVDLVVNYNPVGTACGIGTVIQNVPSEYTEIYYPSKFSYKSLPEAIKELKSALEHKNE